jgi:hypothetical protein
VRLDRFAHPPAENRLARNVGAQPAEGFIQGASGQDSLAIERQASGGCHEGVQCNRRFRFAASAQMTDAAYCQALSDTYRKDVGSTQSTAGGVPEAMANCQSNPTASIPVLEKALTDQKVMLPKRT